MLCEGAFASPSCSRALFLLPPSPPPVCRRHRRRHSGSRGIGRARWGCTSVRTCARHAYTTFIELAGIDNAFRIGSGAQSWAQRASGLQPQAEARDRAAEFGGSAARRREGGAARSYVGSAVRRCAGARVLYHVVHEGLAAERTSPGRAQPSPDLGAERRMQVDRAGVRSRS